MHPNTPCSPHPRGRRRACRGRPREGSGIRAVARSLRGCLDDHVARCVVGYHRSAADDDNRAFPGTLVREESHLLSRPIVPERLGCRGSTISLDPAAAGLDSVGLHPREPVHKVLELATPGAYPLHDHHPATRWHFDGAGAGPRGPGGRSIADRQPARRTLSRTPSRNKPVQSKYEWCHATSSVRSTAAPGIVAAIRCAAVDFPLPLRPSTATTGIATWSGTDESRRATTWSTDSTTHGPAAGSPANRVNSTGTSCPQARHLHSHVISTATPSPQARHVHSHVMSAGTIVTGGTIMTGEAGCHAQGRWTRRWIHRRGSFGWTPLAGHATVPAPRRGAGVEPWGSHRGCRILGVGTAAELGVDHDPE